MCLITNNNIPKTADKDIICYKVIEERQDGNSATPCVHVEFKPDVNGIFKAGFTKQVVPFLTPNRIVKEDEIVKDDEEVPLDTVFYKVASGFVHTFSTLMSAAWFAHIMNAKYRTAPLNKKGFHAVIYECVIPKGVEYYEGLSDSYETKQPAYASTEIKILNKIE